MSEKAIIMAAGKGTRMLPLTSSTPKPLIKVFDKTMIETVIAALRKRGVGDIYVVTGYLARCFDGISKDLSAELICNPDYDSANNISSVYYASEVLLSGADGVFICEADLFIQDDTVLCRDLSSSCYFGRMIKGHSDDWVFNTDDEGFISRVKKGGTDCYNMVGISYFTRSDAAFLAERVRSVYEDENRRDANRQLFWDEVVDGMLGELKMLVEPVGQKDIIEIDTVGELKEVREGRR